MSHREMRNNSGELLRRVADGESVLITNGGVPAALPAPVQSARPSDDLLAEDRG